MPRYTNSKENAERRARQASYAAETWRASREKARNTAQGKTIGRVYVDGKKAYDLEHSAFVCGGVSVSWALIEAGEMVFTGKNEPSGGFTRDPAFCRQAHEIYTREIAGLERYNISKGLNGDGTIKASNKDEKKGTGEMKHNSFRSFLLDLQDTYRGASIQAKVLFDEWEKAQAEYREISNSTRATHEGLILAEADYLREKQIFEDGYKSLMASVEAKKVDLRNDLADKVREYYGIAPEKLDGSTLELLRLGIVTEEDLQELVNKNANNITMLRVLADYAKRMDSKTSRALAITINEITTGKKELEAFDKIDQIGGNGIGMDPVKRRSSEMLFEQVSAEYINSVSNNDFTTGSPAEDE